LKNFCRSTGLVFVLLTVLVLAACGKKAEEPATAEETAAEVAVPETPAEDLRGMLEAKVAEVDVYMKEHDVTNTDAGELADTLEGFQADFAELAVKAGDDEELTAHSNLAAEAMTLYVKSLRAPAGDLSSLELAIDAEAKWTEAKEAASIEPKT
jgi:predicted small lipoprotein YifL